MGRLKRRQTLSKGRLQYEGFNSHSSTYICKEFAKKCLNLQTLAPKLMLQKCRKFFIQSCIFQNYIFQCYLIFIGISEHFDNRRQRW